MKKTLFSMVFFFVVAILLIIEVAGNGEASRALALVTFAAFLWFAIVRAFGKRASSFPLLSLAILYHLLAFLWSHVAGDADDGFLNNPEIRLAGVYVSLVGLSALAAGALLRRQLYTVAIPLRGIVEKQSIGNPLHWFFFGILLWGGQFLLRRFLGEIGPIESLLRLVQGTGVVFLVAAAFDRRLNSVPVKLVAFAIASYEILVGIGGGSLAIPVFLVVQTLALRYYFRRRVSTFDVAVTCVALVGAMALQNAKQEFRLQYWANDSSASSTARAIAFARLALQWPLMRTDGGDVLSFSDSFEKRSSNATALMTVIEMTPSTVPYRSGETFLPLLYAWIPRFLWADKPRATLGNEWAKDYNLLGASDFDTSYNLPWLVEFYMNFGMLGVAFGMFFAGYTIRLLEELFFSDDVKPYCFILGIALVSHLWWLESNVSLTVGNLLTQVVSALALTYLFSLFVATMGKRSRGDGYST